MGKYLKYILFFIIVTSCDLKIEEQVKKNEFGGNTKRMINKRLKTIRDSVFDYSENLISTIDYYDNDSHIKKISHYKNNRLDSGMLEYYYNKNLKSKRFFYLGKECFERLDFTENGKISKYIFLASDQGRFYIRLYDTAGDCIGVRGTPFFESYIYSNTNFAFTKKDTVTVYFYAPNPPDCIVKLYTVLDKDEIDNIKSLNEKFIYRVRIYPLEEGDFEWKVRMKIFDKKNDSLIYASDPKKITYQVK